MDSNTERTTVENASDQLLPKLDLKSIPKIVKTCEHKLHLIEKEAKFTSDYSKYEFEYDLDDIEILPSNSTSTVTTLKDVKLKVLIEFNFVAPTFKQMFQINSSIKYDDSIRDDPFGEYDIQINRELVKRYLIYLNNGYEKAKIEVENNKNHLRFELITTDYLSLHMEDKMLQVLLCNQLVFHISEIVKIYKSIFTFFENGNSIDPEEAINFIL